MESAWQMPGVGRTSTDPAVLVEWFTPRPRRTTEAEIEPFAGGMDRQVIEMEPLGGGTRYTTSWSSS